MGKVAKTENNSINGFKMRKENHIAKEKNSLCLDLETIPSPTSTNVRRHTTNSLDNMKWRSFTHMK